VCRELKKVENHWSRGYVEIRFTQVIVLTAKFSRCREPKKVKNHWPRGFKGPMKAKMRERASARIKISSK